MKRTFLRVLLSVSAIVVGGVVWSEIALAPAADRVPSARRKLDDARPASPGIWHFPLSNNDYRNSGIRYAFVDPDSLVPVEKGVRALRDYQARGNAVLDADLFLKRTKTTYRSLSTDGTGGDAGSLRLLINPNGKIFSYTGKGLPRYLTEGAPGPALYAAPGIWREIMAGAIPDPTVSMRVRRTKRSYFLDVTNDAAKSAQCVGFAFCDRIGLVWWRSPGRSTGVRQSRSQIPPSQGVLGSKLLVLRKANARPPLPNGSPTPDPEVTTSPEPTATNTPSGPAFSRTSATTLTLPASPPIRGFSTERALGNLTFSAPLAVVSAPGETDRLFVVEKAGRIMQVSNLNSGTPVKSTFLDITSRIGSSGGEQGLLALAFHPNFAQNGYFYLWYTLSISTTAGTGRHDRLARYSVLTSNPNLGDPNSEQPLISQYDEEENHNGGELAFGPDGYLYLSTGDEGGGGDSRNNSRRIDKDFFSAVLRIDVDRKPGSVTPNAHAAVHAGTYTIPSDNPFIGATSFNGATVSPPAVRTEFWAVGLRNPFRMSFDSDTGELWLGDVGQGAREEINLVTKGADFGWNIREGKIAYNNGTTPQGAVLTDPIHDYDRAQGTTVTGGLVYRGAALSQLYGAYVFADYGSGRIWSLRRTTGTPRVEQLTTDAGIVGFGLNPFNGDILMADIQEGAIKRLIYNATSTGTPIPETLSATGAFSSLITLQPASGMIEYEVNTPFWSDYALKRRWFALRDGSSTYTLNTTQNWSLPTGAVWMKHFDLETTRGDPATKRRIETRFIVKTADGVYGISYRWNDQQTDATLVPEDGTDIDIPIIEAGVAKTQRWHFPSRAECQTCHTSQGGFALSFNTRQLNRGRVYEGNNTVNQLNALAQAGYLASPTIPDPATLPALSPAEDTFKSVELRARSYLDANCSSCHQPGGNALGLWDARAATALASAGIVNGALIDNGGDSANRVVVPKDSAHSRMLHRIAGSNGASRMPPLATNERNLQAEALVAEWISTLQ